MKRWRCSLILSLVIAISLCWLAPAVNAAETVVYSEGFETNNGGYSFYAGTTPAWQCGAPRADAVGPKAAHSGTNCWGTNLATGGIPRPSEGSILSPVIQLPTLAGNQIIRVRFWAFVDIDGMYDRGEFFVSKDGTNWESKLRMYNTMSLTAAEPPGWRKYECTLDPSYSGSTVYLRFRAAIRYANPSFFCGGTGTLSGLFIDDIAISLLDTSGPQKLFSLQAWEDAAEWASCPWVAPWNGTEFVSDNDVYSVARGPENEYTDYYRLMKPLVARDGVYPITLRETEQEESYTDLAGLLLVDHAADVAVAPDGKGGLLAYREASLVSPQSAAGSGGEDVLASISTADGNGYAAYSGDAVIVDFGDLGATSGATLVLGATGFVPGTGEDRQYTGPPAVVVETEDAAGQWQERGRLNPRFMYSVAAFDLSPYVEGGSNLRVRLRSISHSIKYHLIDYVALQPGPAPAFTAAQVAPTGAAFGAEDILGKVGAADGDYFKMTAGQEILLSFPVLPLASGEVREFVFVAKGYYIPKGGSYLVYTWDGAGWVLRDLQTYPQNLATHAFDLSLFLPDPNGEYRVRVWQDYQYENAGIDYVQMSAGAQTVPLSTAYDYHKGTDIRSLVLASDGSQDRWGINFGDYCPRDRVTEYFFSPPPCLNTPPTTCPVTATNSSLPQICWNYADQEGNPQAAAEVQIWTGPLQTGTIVWNPAVFTGTATCATYAGAPLPPGTYYVGVRALDVIVTECGGAWGSWCWTSFTVSEVPQTICEGPPARVLIDPPTSDLESRAKWVECKVGPPLALPCYASNDMLDSLRLEDVLLSDGPARVDYDPEWGQNVYYVKFLRADVEALFPNGGMHVVKISGLCEGVKQSGIVMPNCVTKQFCGTDTIWIIKPEIQLPTAGQVVDAGSDFPITWDLPGGLEADETSIHYSPDAGTTWTTVAEHLTGSNSYLWRVPALGASSVILAVESYRNGEFTGQGLSPMFTIANGTADATSGLPTGVYLSPPQPSPFGSSTVFRYGLPKAGAVKLSVLDITGRRVRTLVDGMQAPGNQTARWNGQDDSGRRVEPGIYLYRLEGLGVVLSQKVVYLR